MADKPGHSGTSGSVAMRTVGRTIPGIQSISPLFITVSFVVGPARIDRAATGSVSAGQAAAMALQVGKERRGVR